MGYGRFHRSLRVVLITPARLRAASLAIVAVVSLVSCSKAPETEEAMMKAGLEALYARGDPNAAAAQFGKILERNPNHYGATFQLATALERAGKTAEARAQWQKMLALAEALRDKETAAVARARIGQAPAAREPASDDATMKSGLDLLYTKHDPNGAAAEFRKVLARTPNHYGATFQLAAALDQAGKKSEAHPLWEKMLKLAEAANDKETLRLVRERLSRQ
jgi:cytochrome c-type biogenesis protein CcmH/NrfG